MKTINTDFNKLTPDMKKFLLDNHQTGVEVLRIIARLIKNPIVRWFVELLITTLDSIVDKIKEEQE